MLSSLNLQLLSVNNTLEGAIDPVGIGADTAVQPGSSPTPFANILAARTDIAPVQTNLSGDFLPPDGKALPPLTPATPGVLETELAGEHTLYRQGEGAPEPESHGELWQSAAGVADTLLELDIVYPAVDAARDTLPGINLLPPERPFVQPEDTPLENVAVHRDDSPLDDEVVHQQAAALVEPLLAAAVNSETLKVRPPGSEPVVVPPGADALVRDKLPTPAAATVRPAITATDAAPVPDDAPVDEFLPNPVRASSGIETIQAPDTRVAGVSAPQNPAAMNNPGSASIFNIDVSPGRPEMLTDTIGTPVRDMAWGEKLGERILVMTGKQLQVAEIRLTPADLGPVRVRVSVEEGAAHVTFHAQHALTRDAIEQALPRLREMLSENGLALGQTDVSEHGVADGRDGNDFDPGGSNESHDGAGDGSAETALDVESNLRRKTVTSNNLLDTFA